jgi:hypothetical protein
MVFWEETEKITDDNKILPGEKVLEFLEDRHLKLRATQGERSSVATQKPTTTSSWGTKNAYMSKSANIMQAVREAQFGCVIHETNSHALPECRQFLSFTVADRVKIAQKAGICKSCLLPREKCECDEASVCSKCNNRHHTLLHLGNANVSSMSVNVAYLMERDEQSAFPTVVFKAKNAIGGFVLLRGIMDSGAQCALMSEHAAQFLQLP